MAYRIVPDDPESEDYKIWHTRGIGASAAEIVVKGKNKYRETEYGLWEYITKRAEKPPQTAPMLAGLEAEPKIRAAWEKASGEVGEAVNLIDAQHDCLRAQIDWLSWEGDRAVDFKYSYGTKTYENAARYVSATNVLLQESKDFGGWWIAGQHQLMLLDHKLIHYYVWKDGYEHYEPIDLIVVRDDDFIKKLRQIEWMWWERHIKGDLAPEKRKLTLKIDKGWI
jgi:hypothetical protein